MRIFLFILFSILSFSVSAQNKKWELGLGLGSLYGPDYRGSKEYRSLVSPIPYFIYRGKFIRSDRDGIRGNFIESNKFEFNLSASAIFSPDTDENKLREGMPELGSTFEIGPSVNYKLSGQDFSRGLSLQMPLRAVFAIADGVNYAGYLFQPKLLYKTPIAGWNFNYSFGITYADNQYHDYYYAVKPKFATASRPAFDASSGFSGYLNQIIFTRKIDREKTKIQLAFFLRNENMTGCDCTYSSLVETKNAWRSGVAIIWVIK